MFTRATLQTRRHRKLRLAVATVGLVSVAGIIASLAASALPLNPAPAPEFEFDSALDITMDGEGKARVEYTEPTGLDCDGVGNSFKESTLDLSGQEDLTATGAKLQATKNLTLLACDEEFVDLDCDATMNSSGETTTGYIVDAGDSALNRIRIYIVTKTGNTPAEYLNPKVQRHGEPQQLTNDVPIAEASWEIGAGEDMIATIPFTANADTNKVQITKFFLDRSEGSGTFQDNNDEANLTWELFKADRTSIGSGTINVEGDETTNGTLATTNLTAGDDYVLEVTLDTINLARASNGACGNTVDNQANFVVTGEVILTAQN